MNPLLFRALSRERAKAVFYGTSLTKSGGWVEVIDRFEVRRSQGVVVLQVMNPVVDRPSGSDGYRPELEGYESIYREVAKQRGLICIDHSPAWHQLLASGVDEYRRLVPDGLHP